MKIKDNYIVLNIVMAILYIFNGKAGLLLAIMGGNISPIWPPSGLALAAALLWGNRLLPGILAGAILGAWATSVPFWAAALSGLGSAGEAMLGACFYRYYAGNNEGPYDKVKNVIVFILAILVSCPIGAVIGVGSLYAAGVVPLTSIGLALFTWFGGDVTGALITTPVILALYQREVTNTPSQIERIVFFVGFLGLSYAIFWGGLTATVASSTLYMIMPFFIWASFRLDTRDLTVSILLVTAMAIWGRILGLGPFMNYDLHISVVLLQTFLSVVALTGLTIHALVTERDRAKKQLLDSHEALERQTADLQQAVAGQIAANERFRVAFNNSSAAMAIFDMCGRYAEVNQAWQTMTGFSREEAVGRTYSELDTSPIVGEVLVSIKDAVPLQREHQIRMKSGELRWVVSTYEKIDLSGCPHVLLFGLDITDRKQAEYEMAKLGRLSLIGEMAAGIGHEIRNPLTTVRGFLQMLSSKYTKDQEIFEILIGELDRANQIITEFLSLAKNRQFTPVPTSLNQIITTLQPLIESDALLSGKILKFDLAEPIPLINADEGEIRQMILNLTRNGFEAMEANQKLTISTRNIQGNVELRVHDQGTGIPQEIHDHIGTPFFTTKDNGTGLGLAICYNIAHRHGGKITFTTGPQGTVFSITFPHI